ncbi:MAG: hypothetical protein HZB71_03650 [Betaproteobacteria bacterium]|nr:hypothetical protein [Betaproteobacteria bacterium]
MFGFFKRNKKEEDSPLSDLKTVSRWMQELPSGDIYTALENVVQTLIQFNHSGQPSSKERLQVLMHLDEQARDMQHALCIQYLRNPRMSKVIESRLWTAVHAFYWEITRGYHTFLMDHVANPQGSDFGATVPLVTARAIRGFADIFKWRYVRYDRADDKLWTRLHNLYRIAETGNYLSNRFKLYPSDAKPSCCMEEYVQPLLLAPLGSGNLAPRQIEMVDHWLDNWSDLTQVHGAYDPKQHFYFVDITQGFGPRSIQSGEKTQPDYRYLGTHPMLARLSEVEKALRSGALPATLGLGEDFRLPDGYDLIDHVFREWAPRGERDRRLGARRSVSTQIEVMHELAPICHLLEREGSRVNARTGNSQLTPEQLLDIKLYGQTAGRTPPPARPASAASSSQAEPPPLENWTLYDQGDNGIGVSLPPDESDWVKVGKLICFRTDPADSWHLGVVRRITRQQNESRKIGILVMPTPPTLIQLEPIDPGFSTPNAHDHSLTTNPQNFSALLTSDSKGAPAIILEAHKYAHGRLFRAIQGATSQTLQLAASRDKGDGWLLAAYTEQTAPTA